MWDSQWDGPYLAAKWKGLASSVCRGVSFNWFSRGEKHSSPWILSLDLNTNELILQVIVYLITSGLLCHGSFAFNSNMQHRAWRLTLCSNWTVSLAVLWDYTIMWTSRTRRLSHWIFTLFFFKQYILYTICSCLTVFLILHVHANKLWNIQLYMNCALFVPWRPWQVSRAARGFTHNIVFHTTGDWEMVSSNSVRVPVIPCWHGPICHSVSERSPSLLCNNG